MVSPRMLAATFARRRATGYRSNAEKTTNTAVVEAFRQRLRDVAGFKNVPPPLAMKNSTGAVVYYLFFASQKAVAADIIRDIFKRYGGRQ